MDEPETEPVEAAMEPPEQPVAPRTVTAARLTAMPWIAGIALVPLAFVTLGFILGDGMSGRLYAALAGGWLMLAGSALFIGYSWPALRYRHVRYRVDEDGVRIRRGVLWRTVISIPTSRVQHTGVSQGPVERRFEIATLTVHTAGTAGASISLKGLEHGVAHRLRDHLLPDHQIHAG